MLRSISGCCVASRNGVDGCPGNTCRLAILYRILIFWFCSAVSACIFWICGGLKTWSGSVNLSHGRGWLRSANGQFSATNDCQEKSSNGCWHTGLICAYPLRSCLKFTSFGRSEQGWPPGFSGFGQTATGLCVVQILLLSCPRAAPASSIRPIDRYITRVVDQKRIR